MKRIQRDTIIQNIHLLVEPTLTNNTYFKKIHKMARTRFNKVTKKNKSNRNGKHHHKGVKKKTFPFHDDEDFLNLTYNQQRFIKLYYEKEYTSPSKKKSLRNGDIYKKAYEAYDMKLSVADSLASRLLKDEKISHVMNKIKRFIVLDLGIDSHTLVLNLYEIAKNKWAKDADRISATKELGKLLDKYPASKSKLQHSGLENFDNAPKKVKVVLVSAKDK